MSGGDDEPALLSEPLLSSQQTKLLLFVVVWTVYSVYFLHAGEMVYGVGGAVVTVGGLYRLTNS